MSKRESPIGFISILVATFGLSIAGIWSAYQFGFGSHSSDGYTYNNDKKSTSTIKESKKLESDTRNTPVPKPTPTPKKLKTAEDITQNPVQAQIQFLPDSNKITTQGVENLNNLKQEISEFESQNLGIRIYSNPDKSNFGQQIARQRGEEVAGYLRHLGLKNKIVISRRSADVTANQSLVVQLYKLK